MTGAAVREVEAFAEGLADGSYHPAQAKRDLAERIVRLYHGAEAASAARAGFDRVFKEKDRPEDIPETAAAGRRRTRRTGMAAAPTHRDGPGRLQRRGPPRSSSRVGCGWTTEVVSDVRGGVRAGGAERAWWCRWASGSSCVSGSSLASSGG